MSSSDPKINIKGPEGSGDTEGVNLYTADSAMEGAETDTNKSSIPTLDDDESVLYAGKNKKDVTYSGTATLRRLLNEGLGSNAREAIVEYILQLESLVRPEQGPGYTVTDDVRGTVYDPTASEEIGMMISKVSWTHKATEGLKVEYQIEGEQAAGMQNTLDREDYISDERSSISSTAVTNKIETSEGIVPLDFLKELRYERSVDLDTRAMVKRFNVDNLGIIKSGVDGEINMQGEISRDAVTDSSVSSLEELSLLVNDELHGRQGKLTENVTRRVFQGAVTKTSTEWESGVVDKFSYNISFDIGDELLSEPNP